MPSTLPSQEKNFSTTRRSCWPTETSGNPRLRLLPVRMRPIDEEYFARVVRYVYIRMRLFTTKTSPRLCSRPCHSRLWREIRTAVSQSRLSTSWLGYLTWAALTTRLGGSAISYVPRPQHHTCRSCSRACACSPSVLTPVRSTYTSVGTGTGYIRTDSWDRDAYAQPHKRRHNRSSALPHIAEPHSP
jgi:hypothetical protein